MFYKNFKMEIKHGKTVFNKKPKTAQKIDNANAEHR